MLPLSHQASNLEIIQDINLLTEKQVGNITPLLFKNLRLAARSVFLPTYFFLSYLTL